MIVNFPVSELKSLLKKDLSLEEIVRAFDMMGAPVESYTDENIEVEVFPNRVDLLSPEGSARAINGFIGAVSGYPLWEIVPSRIETVVEDSKVRPFVSFSTVLGVELSETALEMLMQMQEKLHLTLGRNRRKYSIGVYDLDKIKSPITYTELPLKDIVFVPLGERDEMNGKEILKKTEKGKAYAHLVGDSAPVLIDGNKNIMSMAPILNAEFCKVTPETKNFFIDSTGTASGTDSVVALIATSLAERGGKLGVVIPGPSYLPKRMNIPLDYVKKLVGVSLNTRDFTNYLGKMRLGYDGDVLIPPYRMDIFAPMDVAEDIAIAYGYEKFKGDLLPSYHSGKPHPNRVLENKVREILVGLGFVEAKSFMLTSPDMLSIEGNFKEQVNNPKSAEYSALRQSLLPGLFNLLLSNTGAEYPQKIFEIGTCFTPEEEIRIAGLISHSDASFSEIKGVVDKLTSLFGKKFKWANDERKFFVKGRCATSELGVYGEVSLELAEKIEMPIAGFELALSKLL